MKKLIIGLSLLASMSCFANTDSCLVSYGLALSSHPDFDYDPVISIIKVLEQKNSDVGAVVRSYCKTQNVSQRACLANFAMGVTSHPDFDSDPVISIIKVLQQKNSPEGQILREACKKRARF